MSAPNATPSLWDFALAFYAKPQIAQSFVNLQDNYGCNVCLLIGLGWMDVREEFLTATELADLESHIQAWTQQVVEPLRSLRRLLKEPIAAYAQDAVQTEVRMLIKQAELLAEKRLLTEIESWLLKSLTKQHASSCPNTENYLRKLNAPASTMEFIQKNLCEY